MTSPARTTQAQVAATALTFDEMLRHNEEETTRWHEWFHAHPEALDVPLDIAGMKDMRGMLLHIFVVEQLYTERLRKEQRERFSYDDFPSNSLDELFGVGAEARRQFRRLLDAGTDAYWAEVITFDTKTSGTLSNTRRKMFAHAMLHSIRHWAQLATALRQAGLPEGEARFHLQQRH
jgi:uncharacterized damage-inducible protein DinB